MQKHDINVAKRIELPAAISTESDQCQGYTGLAVSVSGGGRQRRKRTAAKHQPARPDVRKSRGRLHPPGASGASDALQRLEIFCIAEGLPLDAWCLWAQGGFRHVPKLSPVLEMLSSLPSVAAQFRIANPKAKICDAPEMNRHSHDLERRNYVSISGTK